MADTNISVNNIGSPAPRWYRRVNNAVTLSFLPGYVAIVQSLTMPSATRNICMIIAAAIPFVMNGIGQLLGNGQTYADKT